MKQEGWLVGDGGPFVILGVVDCAWWDGSGDHENSLMEGGTVETDYDVICSVDPGAVVTIRGSSLLVAFDSSEGGAFLNVDGRLVFVQPLALPEERFDPERDVQPHELRDFVSERLRSLRTRPTRWSSATPASA